jgi:hypothetical protein
MARQTYIDGRYASYQAAVPANLVGKEGYAVELVVGTKTIQLFTGQGNYPQTPLGVLVSRLEGQDTWKVALYGAGGTARCVAGGAIPAAPCYVNFQNGGTVVSNTRTAPSHGMKISDAAANAASDIIEVLLAPMVI